MCFDEKLNTCRSESRKHLTHSRLGLRMEMGLRAVDDEHVALSRSE